MLSPLIWTLSPHPSEPDEMIYDDVEFGEEGCGSSLDTGWSSSEFESYDEQSDGEGQGENGLPDAFMRGKTPQKKTTHVCKLSTFTLPLSTDLSFCGGRRVERGWEESGFEGEYTVIYCIL